MGGTEGEANLEEDDDSNDTDDIHPDVPMKSILRSYLKILIGGLFSL